MLTGEVIADPMDVLSGFGGHSLMNSLLAGLQGLQILGIGLIMCSDNGQVLEANRAAQEILSRRDGIATDPDNVIYCTSDETSRIVHRSIRRTANSGPFNNSAGNDVILVPKRQSRKHPLILSIRPTTANLITDGAASIAMILIVDTAEHCKATHEDLYGLYRFTKAETAVANILMDGRSLKDCCDELSRSYSTTRTHLKNMFRKTRVRHQSQLVSLLLRSIGLIRLERA